jgi:integrase
VSEETSTKTIRKAGDAAPRRCRACLVALRWQRLRQAALRQPAGERWQGTGYVFTTRTGRPVEARNIYRSFGRLSRKAGVPIIRLHDARHGYATLLTSQGVPPRVVMEILGHSQIGVTMNVYTHAVQNTQREALATMDQLLKHPSLMSITDVKRPKAWSLTDVLAGAPDRTAFEPAIRTKPGTAYPVCAAS